MPANSGNFFRALNILGVPTALDPADGISGRACFIPTDLHPENQTRSDARRAYYDPYLSRPNLYVVTGQHVTRVLLDGAAGGGITLRTGDGLKAIGVEVRNLALSCEFIFPILNSRIVCRK